MADPFYEPLPEMGQKPWDLGGAVQEIRERIAGTDDVIQTGRLSPGGLSQEIALAAGELNPEALSDTFIAAKVNETNSDTRNAVLDLAMGVSPTWFGAVGDGIADDTAELQATFAAAGTRPVLIDRHYRITAPIVISTNNQTVLGAGGKVLGSNSTRLFHVLANNVSFRGVQTSGGRTAFLFGPSDVYAVVPPVASSLGNGGSVVDCVSDSAAEFVRGNFVRDLKILNNTAVGVKEFGVTLWGGDADPRNATYPGDFVYLISNVKIAGNMILGNGMSATEYSEITAGIWGCAMQDVHVSGNVVDGFTDVGIDFEGSLRCHAVGNTVTNCAQGLYAIFFGSRSCSFVSNKGYYTSPPPAEKNGFSFWGAARPSPYENIQILSNDFGATITIQPYESERVGYDFDIANNKIKNGGIDVSRVDKVRVSQNRVMGGHIIIGGCNESTVSGNDVTTFGEPDIGGIRNYPVLGVVGTGGVISNNVVNDSTSALAGASIAVESGGAGNKKTLVKDNTTRLGVFNQGSDPTVTQVNNTTFSFGL